MSQDTPTSRYSVPRTRRVYPWHTGADVNVAIQCKSSIIEGRGHGWEAVKDVSASVASYAQRYPGVKFSMVAVTNQRFNNTARQQAQVLNVELIEGEDLKRLIAQHPMKRGELERFLLSGWAT